ncbi:unnamed protein product, partial [Brenthis ino]
MVKPVIFVLALALCSVHCKVILKKDILPDISSNLINKVDPKAISALQLELPVYKDIIVNSNVSEKTEKEPRKRTNATSTINETPKICQNNSDNISENLINSDEIVPCEIPKVDNGTALILTPYIENGKIEEARLASRVNSDIFFGIESYSGFLTVNKEYDSNMFFWYFPVLNKAVNETPWIVWLQGGPGASSMTGLFDEIGPFKVSPGGTLKINPYTWLQNHSLIFIDNPVGTGFSFTKHNDGFSKDMDSYGSNLYKTIHQFLKIFPELKSAPLYIAGESYAGKYVPAMAMHIHNHKNTYDSDINLQGVIVGNPYIDPSMISDITRSFYNFGLLNKEQIKIVEPLLKSFHQDIATKNSVGAKDKWTSLITVLLFLTHQKQAYNFLKDELLVGRYVNFLKSSEVKRAIHVGDINFSYLNITANTKMADDFLSSAKPYYEKLLDEQYKVLAYCGQLDQMLPCVHTFEQYRTWKWNGSSEFLEATRYPYIFNARLAGYHKTGGRLTEVVIRGAGHIVPMDEPAPTQTLVARWTHNKPLSRRFGVLEGSYLQEFVRNHSMIYL